MELHVDKALHVAMATLRILNFHPNIYIHLKLKSVFMKNASLAMVGTDVTTSTVVTVSVLKKNKSRELKYCVVNTYEQSDAK